ncbi:glycosyltransferase family 39 protein, partial [Candidatus Pelagibacter sp.]|nr:glycosyltransferase family 39 protein [Candidatus Pelagibacter sp.]
MTKDFGISYDEFWYRDAGFAVLNFLGESIFPEKLAELKESRNLEYFTLQKIVETAPIGFKIQHTIYATIEYLFFDNSEKMTVFFARHYLNFLMSCLMFITFYKILRLRFDKIYSSIGLIMIILSPKIFSHYYYNPNDIWAIFSASLVIYFSLYFLKKNKTKYFYFLSFVFAFSINTRLIFVYFYPIFLFFLFCKTKKLFDIHLLKKIFFQFFLFLLFLFLITPELWINIFGIFYTFLNQLSFPADSLLFFNGEHIRSSELPNYYTFFWILISTPLLYLFMFALGFYCYFLNIKKTSLDTHFMFLFLLIPTLAVLIMKPNLFNDWRHFYFLNLGIIYFATLGIEFFFNFIKNKKVLYFFTFVIFLYFFNISAWMIKNHPYQHVFFNHF